MKIFKNLLFLTLMHTIGFGLTFYDSNKFLLTSPGAMGVGLYGYDNPALLTYLHQFDLAFMWSDQYNKWNDFKDWMLFAGIPNFGLGIGNQSFSTGSVKKYNLSIAIGDKKQSLGIGYEWSTSDVDDLKQPATLKLGLLSRPVKYISTGIVGMLSSSENGRGVYFDVALRPLANERITLFTDCAIHRGIELKDTPWSAGIAIEPFSGFRLTARYFNDRSITAGINFSLGRIGFSSQSKFDSNQEYLYNAYGVRVGAYDRNVFKNLFQKKKNYLEIELKGQVNYQRYLFFDKSNTLLSIIKAIDIAKNDPTISGIALNLSGMDLNIAMLWELREKLKEFKKQGKHIVAYIDEVGIIEYYLASVADKIVLDPQGSINLQGLLMGRMYFKDALDKIGIGVDEWRYFKYKSAAEVLSRNKMSDADREQLLAMLDDFYNTIKKDICIARGYDDVRFEHLVNEEYIFLAQDALKNNLVDTLGRWEAVKEMVGKIEGMKKKFIKKIRTHLLSPTTR